MVRCPFGGPEDHFESKEEAQAQFEHSMAGKTFVTVGKNKKVLVPLPTEYRLRPADPTHVLEYEYDYYGCAGTCNNDDMCRDSTYEGLRVDVIDPSMIYDIARSSIGAKVLPDELKRRLDARMADWTATDNWDIYTEGDYYGDTVVIDLPQPLTQEISEWFYEQDGAMDETGVLPYLRSVGFATKGHSPVDAVKAYLASMNKGKLSSEIKAAKHAEIHSVSLGRVAMASSTKLAQAHEVIPVPVKESGQAKEIAGILVEIARPAWSRYDTAVGEVKLVDGYGRFKHYKNSTSRQKASFVVLRK